MSQVDMVEILLSFHLLNLRSIDSLPSCLLANVELFQASSMQGYFCVS